MFQQMTEICLRALTFLVGAEAGSIVQAREIADRLGISSTYVTKAFQPLARAGWLRSIKGRAGGWMLAVDPRRRTIAELIDVLEPNQRWKCCVVGHVVCSDETACPFHETWKKTLENMERVMRRTRLNELAGFLPPQADGKRSPALAPPID